MPAIMGTIKGRKHLHSSETEAVGVMVVRNYLVNNVEYMVVNGMRDYMPGREAIRLLAHRRKGIGADRVMVFTGSGQAPSFRLYGADGRSCTAGREEYLVLAHYLRKEGIAVNATELVKFLGDDALAAGWKELQSFEIHLTDSFLARLRERDEASSAVA